MAIHLFTGKNVTLGESQPFDPNKHLAYLSKGQLVVKERGLIPKIWKLLTGMVKFHPHKTKLLKKCREITEDGNQNKSIKDQANHILNGYSKGQAKKAFNTLFPQQGAQEQR
ncbi:MAG: hypothetical protein ACQEP8_04685 [Chlamydiota bacterium]